MPEPLTPQAQSQLFLDARTFNGWSSRPVEDETVRQLYALASMGPTAANSSPARFVFVRSAEAKERLLRHVNPGNLAKAQEAPCCVIVATDSQFYKLMPDLFPGRDFATAFAANPAAAWELAHRSSTLEGAYLILAARTLGLDAGPMSGFNAETLDQEFFPDGRWKSNFLCNIGYGTPEKLHPRNPRLRFEQACLDL